MYKIICLIGKSGSGKSTIEQKLCSDLKINHVISHTTRPPRKKELDGLDYFFCSDDYFEEKKEEFIEQRLYKVIKEVIDSYEGKIPEPHYSRLREAMYNYEVEIND